MDDRIEGLGHGEPAAPAPPRRHATRSRIGAAAVAAGVFGGLVGYLAGTGTTQAGPDRSPATTAEPSGTSRVSSGADVTDPRLVDPGAVSGDTVSGDTGSGFPGGSVSASPGGSYGSSSGPSTATRGS